MQILNNLIPIFAVIGLGMVLRHRDFISAEATQAFNRFAYFFALPLFLLYKLAQAKPNAQGVGANDMLWALLTTSILTAVLGWLATQVMSVRAESRGAMIQASFRGNLAFIGLPLVIFTIYDFPAAQKSALESKVLVAILPTVVFFNLGSVIALATYNGNTASSTGRASLKMLVWNVVTNPLLWACAGGGLFQMMGWSLPTFAVRTFEVIGASAFPLALLGIGSQLVSISVAGSWKKALLPTGIKCVACPMIAAVVGTAWGMEGIELQILIMLTATPTAVSSYVLADQMDGDADLAASAVVICTAFSLLSLAVVLAVLGSNLAVSG